MEPVPDLSDLIWALEGEPTWTDKDKASPWPYNSATWELRRGSLLLNLFVHAGYDEVRLRLVVVDTGADLVDLLLRQVQTVELERLADRELLRFELRDDFRGGSLLLQVKPNLSVAWEVGSVY